MKTKLPFYLISRYLDFIDVYYMSLVEYNLDTKDILIQLLEKRKVFRKWKRSSQSSSIAWVRGNISLLKNHFPLLTYQDHFCGATMYLDSIKKEDVDSAIMEGKDRYGRVFITIRYRCLDKQFLFDGSTYPIDSEKINCITVFQRYTDSSCWCKGGIDSHSCESPLLYESSTYLDNDTLDLLVSNVFRMLVGNPCVYYDYKNKWDHTRSLRRYIRLELV